MPSDGRVVGIGAGKAVGLLTSESEGREGAAGIDAGREKLGCGRGADDHDEAGPIDGRETELAPPPPPPRPPPPPPPRAHAGVAVATSSPAIAIATHA